MIEQQQARIEELEQEACDAREQIEQLQAEIARLRGEVARLQAALVEARATLGAGAEQRLSNPPRP
jgi:peptidoglycan hydrolase CwlO-like protein